MQAAPEATRLKRVLIAEDEWIVAAALRRQVQALGYEVVGTVDTGTRVLEMCQHDHPDVVLMDIQMPEMDGLTATRRLMEQCPHPVVVVTGHGDMREEAERAGAMEFVLKPLLQQQIPEILDRAERRFVRYMQVHDQSASCGEALECWQVVYRAVRRAMAAQGLSEEQAFTDLKEAATQAGLSLYEQALRSLGEA